MASTPWRKSGASTLFSPASDSYSPNKKVPLKKGLFADGIWHCNCTPRLPASHFQVKKEGPNKGRWFYTCQKQERVKGCGFFLWGDEAKGREMRAVVGGSRSEPEADGDIWRGEEVREMEGEKERVVGRREKASTKLMAEIEDNDDDDDKDEFGEWPLELEEEKRIVQAVETPMKMGKRGEFVIPGKRKWDEKTLATPLTDKKVERDRDENIFTTPSNKRFKQDSYDPETPNPHSSLRTPSATPTPGPSHLDLNPDSTPKPQQTYDITAEILSLLQNQKIDEEIEGKLKEVLSKHTLRINGIVRGRDISRAVIRSKDERIAELEGVVARLEREGEVDRVVIGHLKGDVRASVERRRGRGRGGRGRG